MGVSKGEGGPEKGLNLAPRQWLLAKEVLVASGGLGVSRNFPGKSSPSSPSPPFFTPFLLLNPFLQFPHPSKPSLQLSRLGLLPLSTPPTSFFLLQNLPYSFQPLHRPLLNPLRTPSESLHRISKRPFLGLFRVFP